MSRTTAVLDDDSRASASSLGANLLDGLNDVHTISDLSKDGVLSVEPRARDGGDEELGAVGVGSSVGHGEESLDVVLLSEVLVVELGSIDRLTSSSVAVGEISSLEHELRDDLRKEARKVVSV